MTDQQQTEMVVRGSLFEPRITQDQRRLAVRYDALRSLLGKAGRAFGTATSLITPPPILFVQSLQNQPGGTVLTVVLGKGHDAAEIAEQLQDWPGIIEVLCGEDELQVRAGGTVDRAFGAVHAALRLAGIANAQITVDYSHDIPVYEAILEFRAPIPRARRFRLWDLRGEHQVSGPFDFQFPGRISIPDPGEPVTVEVEDHAGTPFMVGVVERVEYSGPYLSSSAAVSNQTQED